MKMKVFNYSELHFAEVTFYKIHTLMVFLHRVVFFKCNIFLNESGLIILIFYFSDTMARYMQDALS